MCCIGDGEDTHVGSSLPSIYFHCEELDITIVHFTKSVSKQTYTHFFEAQRWASMFHLSQGYFVEGK